MQPANDTAASMLARLDDNAKRYLVLDWRGADGRDGSSWRDDMDLDDGAEFYATRDRLEELGILEFIEGDEHNTQLGDDIADLIVAALDEGS